MLAEKKGYSSLYVLCTVAHGGKIYSGETVASYFFAISHDDEWTSILCGRSVVVSLLTYLYQNSIPQTYSTQVIHADWILHCVAHLFRVPVAGYVLDGAISSSCVSESALYLPCHATDLSRKMDLMKSFPQMTLMQDHLSKITFILHKGYLDPGCFGVCHQHLPAFRRTSSSESVRGIETIPADCIVNQETASRDVHVNDGFSTPRLLQGKGYLISQSQQDTTLQLSNIIIAMRSQPIYSSQRTIPHPLAITFLPFLKLCQVIPLMRHHCMMLRKITRYTIRLWDSTVPMNVFLHVLSL